MAYLTPTATGLGACRNIPLSILLSCQLRSLTADIPKTQSQQSQHGQPSEILKDKNAISLFAPRKPFWQQHFLPAYSSTTGIQNILMYSEQCVMIYLPIPLNKGIVVSLLIFITVIIALIL
jgi:hypothetical protein